MPGLPAPPDSRALSALERARLPDRDRGLDGRHSRPYEAVRLFIARAVAVRARLRGHERERAGRRRDLRPAPRHAPRDRARRGPRQAAVPRRDPGPARRTSSASSARARATCPSASRRSVAPSPGATTSSTRAIAASLERLSVFRGGFDLEAAEAVVRPGRRSSAATSLDGLGGARRPEPPPGRSRAAGAAVPDARDDPRVRRGRSWRLAARRDLVRRRHRSLVPRPRRAGERRCWPAPTSGAGSTGSSSEHDNLRAVLDRAVADERRRSPRSVSPSPCGASGRSAATCSRRVVGSRPWRPPPGRAAIAGPAGPADGGARRRVLVAGRHPRHACRLRGGGRALACRREPLRAGERALQPLVLFHGAAQPPRGGHQRSGRDRPGVAAGGARPVPGAGRRAGPGERPLGDRQPGVLPGRPAGRRRRDDGGARDLPARRRSDDGSLDAAHARLREAPAWRHRGLARALPCRPAPVPRIGRRVRAHARVRRPGLAGRIRRRSGTSRAALGRRAQPLGLDRRRSRVASSTSSSCGSRGRRRRRS